MSSKAPTKTGAKAKPAAAKPTASKPAASKSTTGAKTGAKAPLRSFGAAKGKGKAPPKAATPPTKTEPEQDPGRTELFEKTIPLKQVADVVLNDVNDVIKNANKSPLVIDADGNSAVFFKYRNVNFIEYDDAVKAALIEPERLRLAIIHGIRYGKPVAVTINLDGKPDLFKDFCDKVNTIHEGLADMLLDTSVLKDEKFMVLVREEVDGPEFKIMQFNDSFMQHFRFIVMTKTEQPPTKILEKFYVVRIEQN